MSEWHKNFGKTMNLIFPDHNKTHGLHNTLEYGIWRGIKKRCQNPKHPAYKYYGGRGIKICEEWANDVAAFVRYMGPRPSPDHSVDRWPDPSGNYEPGNVRWATRQEQGRNKPSINVVVEFNGRRLTIVEWAEVLGIKPATLYWRICRAKWPPERAFTEIVHVEKYGGRSNLGFDVTPSDVGEILARGHSVVTEGKR